MICIKKKKEGITKKQLIKTQIIFSMSIFIGLLPMLVIGEFPIRATLPYETMFLVGILANVSWILENMNLRKILIIMEIIFTIGIGYKLIKNVSVAENYMLPYKEQIKIEIYQAKMNNEKTLTLSAFKHLDKISVLGQTSLLIDFSPQADKNHIINTYMATYYGFDSIEIKN